MSTDDKSQEPEVLRAEEAWGSIVVNVSPDRMEAVVTSLTPPEDQSISPEKVLEAVKNLGITHGVDAYALMELAELAGTRGWSGEKTAARGTPPAQPDTDVTYPFADRLGSPPQMSGSSCRVGEVAVSFTELAKLFEAQSDDAVTEAELSAIPVAASEVIARCEGPLEPSEGTTIFGDTLKVEATGPLACGEHVTLDMDAGEYRSEIYGYFHTDGSTLSVIPPFRVSEDQLTASFVAVPPVGTPPPVTAQDLGAGLTALGIGSGHDTEGLAQAVEAAAKATAPTLIVVARGEPPVPGTDARLDYAFDIQRKPGVVLEDGSIDLRERNIVNNVKAGDLIATKVEATAGTPGRDLLGEEIETTDGEDLEPKVGEGVEVRQGSTVELRATVDGAATLKNGVPTVTPVFKVDGDVDFETGNLAIDDHLYVSGSIQSGFTVDVGGDATVVGAIEPGAKVRVKGDLNVGGGILGDTTSVVALGDLRVKFIQTARVLAGGELWVGSYIHNADVQCGGSATIERGGGERGGTQVGGRLAAFSGIRLATLGSDSTTGTTVCLQADLARLKKLENLREKLDSCDQSIAKITRTLGIQEVSKTALMQAVERAPAGRKDQYKAAIEGLDSLVKAKAELQPQHDSLVTEIDRALASAEIEVQNELHPGVVVRIGSAERTIAHAWAACKLRKQDDTIVVETSESAEESEDEEGTGKA